MYKIIQINYCNCTWIVKILDIWSTVNQSLGLLRFCYIQIERSASPLYWILYIEFIFFVLLRIQRCLMSLPHIFYENVQWYLPYHTSPKLPWPSLRMSWISLRSISHWSRMSGDRSHIWGCGFGHGLANTWHSPKAFSVTPP